MFLRRLAVLNCGVAQEVQSDMCPETTHDDPPYSAFIVRRWSPSARRLGFLFAILLLEYLLVSFVFDAESLADRGGAWTWFSKIGTVGPWAIAGGAAFVLLPRTRKEECEIDLPSIRVAWVGAHLVLMGGFAVLSFHLFSEKKAPEGSALLWIGSWGFLGFSALAALVFSAFVNWTRLLGRAARAGLVGAAVGTFAWSAGSLTTALWAPLSRATFYVVATLLHWTGFELLADYDAVLLELDGFAIVVAPTCSGFEGIGLFVALMAAYLYRLRATFRFPRAALLLPLGVCAVWFGNAIRIAALMVVGARLDPQIAIGSFHSKAGWVFFSFITLLFAWVSRRIPFFVREEVPVTSREIASDVPSVAPYLVPLLVWIAGGLVTSSFFDGHDPYYGFRVLSTSFTLFVYRAHYLRFYQRPGLLAVGLGLFIGTFWLIAAEFFSEVPGIPPFSPSSQIPETPGWHAFRILGAVGVVPVFEELAFRGFLARRFVARDFEKVPFTQLNVLGTLGSSLMFGAVHGQWVLGTITGVLLALLIRRSGRLSDAVVAHATSNAAIAIWVLSTQNYQHW